MKTPLKGRYLFYLLGALLIGSCKKQEVSNQELKIDQSILESDHQVIVTSDTISRLTQSQIQLLRKPKKVNVNDDNKISVTKEAQGFTVNRTNNTHYCEAYFTDPYSVYCEWELLKNGQVIAYLGATSYNTSISFNIENPSSGNYSVRFTNTYYDYVFSQYVTSPPASTGGIALPVASIFVRNDNTGAIFNTFEGQLRSVPSMTVLNNLFYYNEYYVLHYTASNTVLPSLGSPYASNSRFIKTSSSPDIYLQENNTIRRIIGPAIAAKYGFNISNYVTVSSLSGYTLGSDIY